MNIRCLFIMAAFALAACISRVRADTPEHGDFASYGVQWTPPTGVKYSWPLVKDAVADYDFRGNDRSAATIRVEIDLARQKSVADFADLAVKKYQARVLTDTVKIGGESAVELTGLTTRPGYRLQTMYVAVHDKFLYTFTAYTSGNPDQAAQAAKDALDELISNVRFMRPSSPVERPGEDLMLPLRYEGDLRLRLPSMMRKGPLPQGKDTDFVLHDYASGADLMDIVCSVSGDSTGQADAAARVRVGAALKKVLNCPEDPVLTPAAQEPRILVTQPLHAADTTDGKAHRTVQVAIATLGGNRELTMIFTVPDQGGANERMCLRLAEVILNAARVVPTTPAAGSSARASAAPR